MLSLHLDCKRRLPLIFVIRYNYVEHKLSMDRAHPGWKFLPEMSSSRVGNLHRG